MNCPNCKAQILKGDYFCSECGYPNPRHEYKLAMVKNALFVVAGPGAWEKFKFLMGWDKAKEGDL